MTDEGHYRRFRSRCCQSAHGRSRPSGRTRKPLIDDEGESPRDNEACRKPFMTLKARKSLCSLGQRGRKSSCSLGQSEVLVVSRHRKSSRSGAHRYVNLSRLAGIVDLAVGCRIPSSCKPPSRRISVATFTQGSRAHLDLNGIVHAPGIGI